MFLNIPEPLPLIPSFSSPQVYLFLSLFIPFFFCWPLNVPLLSTVEEKLRQSPSSSLPTYSSAFRHLSNVCLWTTRESLCCARNSVDLILITASTFAGRKSIALKELLAHTLPSSGAELTGTLAKWTTFLTARQSVFFSLSRYHYRDQVLFSRQAVTEQNSPPQGRQMTNLEGCVLGMMKFPREGVTLLHHTKLPMGTLYLIAPDRPGSHSTESASPLHS